MVGWKNRYFFGLVSIVPKSTTSIRQVISTAVRLKAEQSQLVSVGWWFGLRLIGLQGA